MKNRTTVFIVLILLVIIGIAIFILIFNNENRSKSNKNTESITKSISKNNVVNESEEKMNEILKISVNNKNYIANLEQNETVKQFLNLLPQEFNMKELNGNEKYVYINTALPTNSHIPDHIEIGDIMLYGNNCLVIFYKSFETSYSYTKIGHIENFEDLGNKDITIKFEK